MDLKDQHLKWMGEVMLEDQSLVEELAPQNMRHGYDDYGVRSFEDAEVAPAVAHLCDLFLEWSEAP